MKVRFYCDIWPGSIPTWGLSASTNPNVNKIEGFKRFAFDVAIPDNLLHEVDVVSPEPVAVTLIEDNKSAAASG